MASTLKQGGLALAIIVIIVAASTFDTTSAAEATISYNHARQLATDCNSDSTGQSEIEGCGGSDECDGCGSPAGSSLCKNGCCKRNKLQDCICCY
ncbi:hypothetical protein HanRHA438_Chr17g0817281 [Helianthus annuus]|nr:hypothetical protein HanIR_Chr17g0876251 [Helianthus annuus]KAJ0820340.1 hypothetical protein HanPSC8_Chr16g0706791 [Helianthus annuus]KAJ0826706.1 hypothetical protein HanRHA438_Chr17g0817281 [Helianthus annuus]